MQVIINRKGTNGAPRTDIVADLTGLLTEDGVSITTAALWGCLEATIKFTGTLDDAYDAAESWLADPVTIYSDDADWLWEGRIWSVTYGSGGRRRTRSLEGYANTVRIVYDEINAATVPPTVTTADKLINGTDSSGVALYGAIDYLDRAGQLTAAEAIARRARALNDRKRLLYLPDGGSGTLGDVSGGDGVIELYCVGWYHVLMDASNATNTTAGTVEITTIIENFLTARCPLISTDYSQMVATGVSASQQTTDHNSVGEVVKKLIETANGFTFGIGQGRIPYLRANGRADTAPTYIEQADGRIEDASGGEVALWSIQPDCILRQADMVPAGAGLSATAIDNVESIYLLEVTYQTPGRLSYKTSVAGVDGSVNPI